MPNSLNDNAAAVPGLDEDPRGRAALLLVESLIHRLIERSVITQADAVQIAETACDVEEDRLSDPLWTPPAEPTTAALLAALHGSLQRDLNPV